MLALIRDHKPGSVAELAQLAGRAQPNLTRTLAKLEAAGFTVESSWYFNFLGVFGWYLSSRILRRKTFPPIQLRLYDLLVPLFRLEDRVRLPFGMSLVAIARRPVTAG